MTNESKLLLAGIGILVCPCIVGYAIKSVKEVHENDANRQLDLEKTKIQATYPPEYWNAKAAESAANAEIEKTRIERDERLVIDSRVRDSAEKEARRQFEMNAPEEYWAQKRIEEQERTKREADKLRYQAEEEAARQHRKAVEESARIAEKTIKRTMDMV